LFFFHFLVGRLGFYFHETIIEKSRPPTSLIVLFNAAGLSPPKLLDDRYDISISYLITQTSLVDIKP